MTANGAAASVMSSPPVTVCISETASPQTVLIKGKRYRQRPLGPAPFASFEDSSDELDSPPEAARAPGLPGIKEDPASQLATPVSPHPAAMTTILNLTQQEEQGLKEALAGQLDAPVPPRIDISRASSSSQHEDSITSSPDHEGPHNLGYKEDGALDLRSSTEELDYTQEAGTVEESEAKRKRERMMRKQQQQDFGETQSEHDIKERKDSSCSVVSDFGGHLYIGGRTSRLSSVGSAASGGSAASAASHLSGVSHLSATSRLSRGSRSPSPHKMLLETSFCGGKPMPPAQSIDVESAPSLVSHVEKPSSRPPSRLRSRSPSPHKMLLETSFCGTKQIAPLNKDQEPAVKQTPIRRRSSNTLTPEMITAVEIVAQPSSVTNIEKAASPTPKSEVKQRKEKPIAVEEKGKVVAAHRQKKKSELDEIRRADEVEPVSVKPVVRKPLNLAKMMERKIQAESKPKKVISLRDIPGDEIFIPLTGPEIDFDDIIRKASPKLSRKEPSQDTPDVIYIPLHSPPKEKEPVIEVSSRPETKLVPNQVCEDGSIYIPLHSPPKSSKDVEPAESVLPSASSGTKGAPKPYEVCEDGSIYIPLHTPEEEKSSRTFEEEIKRVERELQRVRAAEAERREREREQQKPVTLDLTDASGSRSMLSQSCPSGRQEFLSGSHTPSPGSSLSRKSSFASIFRRSELSASPDSPCAGGGRKKSGTFSNILKDATDGLRDRSRSRSKSKDRSSTCGVSRSPSFKKNVFGGLFFKKKDEGRTSDADDSEMPPLDVQFTFSTPQPTFQGEDRGDYIFIPLRDPNDPPEKEEVVQEVTVKKPPDPPSPVVIEEIKDSPKTWRRSRELDEPTARIDQAECVVEVTKVSTVMSAYRSPLEEKPMQKIGRVSLASPVIDPPQTETEKKIFAVTEPITIGSAHEHEVPLEHRPLPPEADLQTEAADTPSVLAMLHPRSIDSTVQDSSLELEDDPPREELVTVATDGVRKLKLPPEPGDLDDDHERKGLVVQDSFEEELPYVPTTLPLERAFGVTLIPAKERVSEVKTCPIDRPRSTTPINPASLEDYMTKREAVRVADKEKMKISLPRDDSIAGRSKSPRRFSGKGKSWFEFAEAGLPKPGEGRKNSLTTSPSPPPLPPRADGPPSSPPQDFTASATPPAATWINFEELPEKRKLPKKITTLPVHRGSTDGGAPEKSSAPVVFSYVNPEDCQCECHDHNSGPHVHKSKLVAAKQWTRERTEFEVNGESECEDCSCVGRMQSRDFDEEPLLENQKDGVERPDMEEEPLLDSQGGDVEEEPLLSSLHSEDRPDMEDEPLIYGIEDEHLIDKANGNRAEVDMEETPLLDANSDDESMSRCEMEWTAPPGSRLEVELPPLSDSSFEAVSIGGHEVSPTENASELIPFAMDLDIHSNRSSMTSQNEDPSPDGCSKGLPKGMP